MLNYARQRAMEILKISRTAVLATSGPAGVQAGEFPCEACGLDVYLLVPRTSDHLFNLEFESGVALLAGGWELRGEARLVPPDAAARELRLARMPGAEWCVLVRVIPRLLQVRREAGWGSVETIDLKSS